MQRAVFSCSCPGDGALRCGIVACLRLTCCAVCSIALAGIPTHPGTQAVLTGMWTRGWRTGAAFEFTGDHDLILSLALVMFEFSGVGWAALGLLISQYERRCGKAAPRVLGVAMALSSLLFAALVPVSGFLVWALVGAVVAVRGSWAADDTASVATPHTSTASGWTPPAVRTGSLVIVLCCVHTMTGAVLPALQVRVAAAAQVSLSVPDLSLTCRMPRGSVFVFCVCPAPESIPASGSANAHTASLGRRRRCTSTRNRSRHVPAGICCLGAGRVDGDAHRRRVPGADNRGCRRRAHVLSRRLRVAGACKRFLVCVAHWRADCVARTRGHGSRGQLRREKDELARQLLLGGVDFGMPI